MCERSTDDKYLPNIDMLFWFCILPDSGTGKLAAFATVLVLQTGVDK